MKKMIGRVMVILLLLASCEENEPYTLISQGGFPKEPVNFGMCNSAYDDYNSSIHQSQGEDDLVTYVFSSNRQSKGNDFDFIVNTFSLVYPADKNEVTIEEFSGKTNRGGFVDYYMPSVNTPNNELGPFMMSHQFNSNATEEYMFFYTQEVNNRCSLKFYKFEYDNNHVGYTPYEINILNDENYNVGYLTIQNNKLYYNCDVDGNYDIYELPIDTTMEIVEFLTQHRNLQSQARKIVSSGQDDKCPYVVNDFMVFSSKREDGYGGFDLWYSKLQDEVWSEPVNMGEKMNSVSDEYRPIIIEYKNIPNDLMIFSSNRTGGHGGFDLYYTGITLTKDSIAAE